MSNIKNTFINALLADATYVKGLADGLKGQALSEALELRMTLPLAQYIAANFEVASHINTSDGLTSGGSGFDATAWRGRAVTQVNAVRHH